MKTVLFIIAVLVAVKAFPKNVEEPTFKRLYVDPLKPVAGDVISRIINGQEAIAHSIPFQAYLVLAGVEGRWLCGGSLISTNYVLTAGHCVVGALTAEVYLGAHNIQMPESTTVIIVSENLTYHEKFDAQSISYDIGLIELPEPIELSEIIDIVSLPSHDNNTYEGSNAQVSGWGLTIGGGQTSPVLLEVNSTVISNIDCNSYYGNVQEYQVCISGDGGIGSCNGDSGGPLVVENELIGLVSYGVMGCLPGYPSAFTRTASFLDWIEEHTDLEF